MTRPLVVLGATGSIGRQTIEVASYLELEVAALVAGSPSDDLAKLATEIPEAMIVVAEESAEARARFGGFGRRVEFGEAAVAEAAARPGSTVVNGIVGAAGLRPSVAALLAGNRLALANKESLVAGGPVVRAALEAGHGELIPVDSEHSALWQCLVGEDIETVRRLILTASGGPFRGADRARLASVTVDEALRHPTWNMGPRITVDSATLVNKALEVIEAYLLFEIGLAAIDVVVHPKSIVHSLVEFVDGSIKAQLGDPDMRKAIQYAITYPGRQSAARLGFDLTAEPLVFEPVDRAAFRGLDLGYQAGTAGGSAPAVLNAADEVAVDAFLAGRIGFLSITDVIEECLDAIEVVPLESVDHVMEIDAEARRVARSVVS